MKFLLQENSPMDIEIQIVKKLIDEHNTIHSYEFYNINDIKKENNPEKVIPIGSIEFVEKYLKINYNIEKINPIEIPECLRKFEFTKRNYSIINSNNIPKEGKYFLKNVSKLKDFSYSGDLKNFDFSKINENDLYQISELIDIKEEYRIYVINGEIENICQYNGYPSILTNNKYIPDAALINKMNTIFSMQKDSPKSYTIDIITNDNGTALIEIHPFISVGLYSTLWGTNLLNAYIDGIDYVIKHNTKINQFKITK